ncbi:MAG: 2-hydroxyacid dehydrogenase [Parvibaculales bacterium]
MSDSDAPKDSQSVKVVVLRQLPQSVEQRMSQMFDVVLNRDDRPFSRQDILAAMQDADVLVPTVTDKIDAEMIAQAGPGLKLIANFGNGVDNIDVDAAHERGVTVTNTPSVLTEDTADMVAALLLALPRRMVEGDRVMRVPDSFSGWSPNWMLGRRLAGKTLGIVGMGRIGQAVARRAKVFGLKVVYHNRNRLHEDIEADLAASYCPKLDDLMAAADFLSLNCPHTEETTHLINAQSLQLMRRDSYLINTSRGKIVDENALADALSQGRLAGAALDVFEREPAVNPRLLEMENVILLPHMSSATIEGRDGMGEKVLINIRTFADGHRPPDRVLPSHALHG